MRDAMRPSLDPSLDELDAAQRDDDAELLARLEAHGWERLPERISVDRDPAPMRARWSPKRGREDALAPARPCLCRLGPRPVRA
jgi:hypothetical protein